jgi:spermidine synthase
MPQNAKSSHNQHVAPFIYEEQNCKSLHFTIHQLQSKMSISRPDELKVDYTKTMMGFVLLNRRPKHIVMIGLGGGSLAKFCYKHLPESRITVIEINPHVIALRNEFLIPLRSSRPMALITFATHRAILMFYWSMAMTIKGSLHS